MDRPLIEAKLESLRRCVRRVEERRPASADQLASNPDLQDIIALNLTRAVQLCVDIGAHIIAESESPVPSSMASTFDILGETGILMPDTAEHLKRAVDFDKALAMANRGKLSTAYPRQPASRHRRFDGDGIMSAATGPDRLGAGRTAADDNNRNR